MKTIYFTEWPSLPNSDLTPEFSTTIKIGNYSVKLLHCFDGVGMTDKYQANTYLEVYNSKGENITYRLLLDSYFMIHPNNIEIPVLLTSDLLIKVLQYLNMETILGLREEITINAKLQLS